MNQTPFREFIFASIFHFLVDCNGWNVIIAILRFLTKSQTD